MNPNKVALQKFVLQLHREIDDFRDFWLHKQARDPNTTPLEMTEDDWNEQFTLFLEEVLGKDDGKADTEKKIEEIMEVAEKVCTEWEQEFMESVAERSYWSEKQLVVIDRIYEKVCKSPY